MAAIARRITRPVSTFAAYCFSTDAVGDLVFIMGAKVGSRYQVTKIDVDDASKIPAVGILISKSSPTECEVQTGGVLKGVYSGLTPGKALFAGTDARPSHTYTRPTTGKRWVQMIATALSAADIVIEIQRPVGVLPA